MFVKKLKRHMCYYDNILFQLFPRIVLVCIFLIDVFYLKSIEIFYYCIPLTIIPLLYRYIMYSLEYALEQYIQHLEAYYTHVYLLEKDNLITDDTYVIENLEDYNLLGTHNPNAIHHDKFVSIRDYIKIQTEIILNYDYNNDKNNYSYIVDPLYSIETLNLYLKNKENLVYNAYEQLK